ncbi:hypothetical protein [Lacimicrobium alkaliphilum]|uniref:Uncharacterized protein n=1 Tax=Lacimicrobium alkaliphilum TaxID=1526571 RepID=A0A0U3B2V9_9ALTE|nr:hypothetical protein [Lacimicrobium alkaliphilum]ALS97897.1 hypothetical protein AT746_06195 [Lacimicrobium alkaliphilum]
MVKTIKKVEKSGRNTWLAGLGGYDTSRDVAAEKIDQLVEGTGSTIDSLVSRGQLVEADLKKRLQLPQWLNQRLATIRASLNPGQQQLQTATHKLDQALNTLEAVLENVEQEQKKAEQAKKAAATKAAAAKKAAASKSTKAKPANASAANKTTVAKPGASKSSSATASGAKKSTGSQSGTARKTTSRKTAASRTRSKTSDTKSNSNS